MFFKIHLNVEIKCYSDSENVYKIQVEASKSFYYFKLSKISKTHI